MPTFTFEWADEGDAFTGAYDENVFAFEVQQAEGEFATLKVELRNPRVGLLTPARKLWAWLGYSEDGSTAGATPLFFGRVVGVPESITDEIVSLQFIARSSDYDAQKVALAETLKVEPYWDPVWINPAERQNPDVVLEARPQHWNIDRTTHAVTVSDIIEGEDGTITLSDSDMFYDSLALAFRDSPITTLNCTATVYWDQAAKGTVDLTDKVKDAFVIAGSPVGVVTSYTGQGLQEDWPEKGDNIGGGWNVGRAAADRVDGISWPSQVYGVELVEAKAGFPLWYLDVTFNADYDVSRSRSEVITFTMTADVQPLVVDSGDDTTLDVSIYSQEVGSLVDGSPGTEGLAVPIGDVRRPSYFLTDRGKRSLEYLIVLARARMLARARAVALSRDITFDAAVLLSCRKSVIVNDDRLPGGSATGKVVAYSFGLGGDSGKLGGNVSIACTVGRGGTASASAGAPGYVVTGYVDEGYQIYTGGATALAGSSITYSSIDGTVLDDDGLDLVGLTAESAVVSCVVVNGQTTQQTTLSGGFEDISEAIEALNTDYTEVALTLQPLVGGPFETAFPVTVSELKVPKTIDLETA